MNKLKNNVLPNFIALILLWVLVTDVYTVYAKRQRPKLFEKVDKKTVRDFETQFGEKEYWLEKNENGEKLICSRRMGLYPEFWKSSEIRCHKAEGVESTENDGRKCWYANGAMLCEHPNKKIKHRKVKKICKGKPKGILLGKTKKTNQNGKVVFCNIIKSKK